MVFKSAVLLAGLVCVNAFGAVPWSNVSFSTGIAKTVRSSVQLSSVVDRCFKVIPNKYSSGYAVDSTSYALDEALRICLQTPSCAAVTCKAGSTPQDCTMRASSTLKASPTNEATYYRDCVWCGGHAAESCGQCPGANGANFCNGECVWNHDLDVCTDIPPSPSPQPTRSPTPGPTRKPTFDPTRRPTQPTPQPTRQPTIGATGSKSEGTKCNWFAYVRYSVLECQNHLYCELVGPSWEDAECTERPYLGRPCQYDQCQFGLVCSTDGRCMRGSGPGPLPEGESCEFSTWQDNVRPCQDNLYCGSSYACAERESLGSPCFFDGMCQKGLVCNSMNKCSMSAKLDLGQRCGDESDCNSGRCCCEDVLDESYANSPGISYSVMVCECC